MSLAEGAAAGADANVSDATVSDATILDATVSDGAAERLTSSDAADAKRG